MYTGSNTQYCHTIDVPALSSGGHSFPSIANICLNILYFIYFIKLNRIIVINVSKMKRLMAILLEMIITAVISLDNFDISQDQNLSRTKG